MCVYACTSTYEDVYVCVHISTCGDDCVRMCVLQPMRMCVCLFLPIRMHVCVKICEDAREQTTLGVVPYVLSTILGEPRFFIDVKLFKWAAYVPT